MKLCVELLWPFFLKEVKKAVTKTACEMKNVIPLFPKNLPVPADSVVFYLRHLFSKNPFPAIKHQDLVGSCSKFLVPLI